MNEEIKEILESSRKIIKSNRENGFDRIIMLGDDIDKLSDYITNLQQELQKANDTIKELRDNNALDLVKISINSQYINTQNENIRLRQENETLKAKLEIGKTCGFCPYYDYKQRNEKAIELYKKCKEEDYCILSIKMYEILNGSDENGN